MYFFLNFSSKDLMSYLFHIVEKLLLLGQESLNIELFVVVVTHIGSS